ncbi:FAD/NAD(P)-binding domain-containing protein [Aulographum hederae CBS 113979]|uniref:FAD/NAD(P)-binding domain-containing protein n=1 Tax=Aulographum hederae CBS 113979 TaxID=1176131 RepID=A0A6G1GL62_9PEZI|nr:FAD/NAD(P)-binding domain-containing protein [Aulographum hederae CBS 113979]
MTVSPTPPSKPVGSYPSSGIDVLIVGTGLAGLTAAIECIRKGHNVKVLERNADINTAGDMYFMGLSATRFFKHWPELAKEYDAISLHDAWIETFKHSGEVMIRPLRVADRLRAQGLDPSTPPGTFQMRPLVYKMFVHQVERLGVNVQFNSRVVDYFEDEERGKAGVVTEDGSKYEADVVIAADGVGSKSQKIVGGQVRAMSSGRAMWRAAFPIENLDKDPEVKEFFHLINGSEPIVRTWLGPSTYGLTLTRPDTMIWILNHDVTGSEAESWNSTIEADEVLENMDKSVGPTPWAPIFKKLVRCTPPKTIINFELLWRNPQPSWTSPAARVIQIGDSAHSYLPASGNGATQAVEDAISLASCLQIGGKENISQSVRAHIRFRFIRNACAQKLGFSNAELLQDTDWDKVKLDPRRAAPKLPRWVWSHDPEQYAYENYDKCAESMKKGIPFDEDTSIPPNYPPGYKYEPWNIETIMEDMRKGKPIELGSGNWD